MSFARPIEAVVFDTDSLLIDSMAALPGGGRARGRSPAQAASGPLPRSGAPLRRRAGLLLALEDSHNSVSAAQAAGMISITAPGLLDPTDEMRGLCTQIAESLHAVRALIEASP